MPGISSAETKLKTKKGSLAQLEEVLQLPTVDVEMDNKDHRRLSTFGADG